MPEEQSFAAFTEQLEIQQMHLLGDRLATKSLLYHLADGEQTLGVGRYTILKNQIPQLIVPTLNLCDTRTKHQDMIAIDIHIRQTPVVIATKS